MTTTNSDDKFSRQNFRKVEIRMVSELIGLCQGLRASGRIEQAEAEYLRNWFFKNQAFLDHSTIGLHIFNHVSGSLELEWSDETAQLIYDNLGGVTGDMFRLSEEISPATYFSELGERKAGAAQSKVVVTDKNKVCFTGKFESGSRAEVAKAAEAAGFEFCKSVTQELGILVVGGKGSSDGHVFGNIGAKGEKAIKYRDQGFPIEIIFEAEWLERVGGE